jgi:uncharacterized membrane protein
MHHYRTQKGGAMSNGDNSDINRDEMPFVAPCRQLSPWAPFRWIKLGVVDLLHAPQQSLLYGLAIAVMIAVVSLLAWFRGSQWIMFAMLGGFVFLAPLTCIGLYAISAQIERGLPPLMARSLKAAFNRHFGNAMIFAIILLIIFLVWARAAIMITVFIPTDGELTFRELWPYLSFGSIVGAVFAGVTFSASAFSLPMIVHRNVDSVTAIVTSVNAVLRNKGAMLVWVTIIVASLLIGLISAFVGLVVIVPIIGYAAWHGYLETIDADQFPRHDVGITSVPRSNSSAT